MTGSAPLQNDWAAVIAAHPLESHDPQEWLRYGVALLATLEPGEGARQRQQQAALAFLQASKEGATAEQVAAAQWKAALVGLQQALDQAGIAAAAATPGLQPATVAPPTGPPVTLTAIHSRLDQLSAVMDSLRGQTLRPARVHLHLSEQPHLLDAGVAAEDPLLQELAADPWVQLHWVPNLGPYRKIVPYLEAGGYGESSELVISVDDDTLYPPRFVEYLLHNHERYGCIVAHRGRRICPAEEGGFLPYSSWHDGLREPRLGNLPTGQSGVLYRRSDFPADLELEAALALAPTHDDLWLRWLTARQGVAAVILQPNAVVRTQDLAFPGASATPIEKQGSLWFAYNASEAPAAAVGGNDAAVALITSYFQARGFDLEACLRQEQEAMVDLY